MNYPNARIVSKEKLGDNVINIPEERLCDVHTTQGGQTTICGSMIEKRGDYEFENQAIYLPEMFDYILLKDSAGIICLVPLNKEK